MSIDITPTVVAGLIIIVFLIAIGLIPLAGFLALVGGAAILASFF